MNETLKDWLTKADGDYRTANRELDVSERANFDAVCFHAQQCVEKTMKGVLIKHGLSPPRTHNLLHLADMLRATCPTWECSREDLRFLTNAGIAFRYPGEWANSGHAAKAVTICTRLREGLLQLVSEE